MKKLCVAIALGCAAVMALAGCGGKDNRTSHSVEELQSEYGFQWEDTSKPILNETGAKEISFNIYAPKDGNADAYEDMEVMEALYENTNVSVTWENVDSYQHTLLFSQHKGIDGVYHAGLTTSEIVEQAEKRRLLCISDYLKYMPNFSKILEDRPDIKSQITNPEDDKIYTLPRVEEMGLKQNPNLLFLNKTWTEKAIDGGVNIGITKDALKDGLQLNADQMELLLKYFKEHDMNGNNKDNDERPLSFVSQNWQGNQCDLFGMFGINENPDHRVIKNGKVTYTYFEEGYHDAVKFIRGWVDKGYIDKVSFEQTQDNFLANGKTGVYGAFYWWESATVVSDPDNYICCAPLKGPQTQFGGKYKDCQTVCVSNAPEIDIGELFFFDGVPNVEVLLAYFDRYYMPDFSAQVNYGPIGTAFEDEKDDEGRLVPKAQPDGKTADEIRLKYAPLGICYLTASEWGKTVVMEPRAQLRLERLQKYALPYYNKQGDTVQVEPVPNLQFTLSELDEIDRYTAITAQMDKLVKFLYDGDISDSAWASYINDLKSPGVGVNEVLKIYQAAYDRVKSGT